MFSEDSFETTETETAAHKSFANIYFVIKT